MKAPLSRLVAKILSNTENSKKLLNAIKELSKDHVDEVKIEVNGELLTVKEIR